MKLSPGLQNQCPLVDPSYCFLLTTQALVHSCAEHIGETRINILAIGDGRDQKNTGLQRGFASGNTTTNHITLILTDLDLIGVLKA
jgi:hypothetical protein